MEIRNFKEEISIRREIQIINDTIKEYLELFLSVTKLKYIEFYKYDYIYKKYNFSYSIGTKPEYDEDLGVRKHYSIVLKKDNIVFGKILITRRIKYSKMLKTLLDFLAMKLLQKHNTIKNLHEEQPNLSVYIVDSNGGKDFVKQLHTDLKLDFNANIVTTNRLTSITSKLEDKNNKNILVYIAKDHDSLVRDKNILKQYNDYIIVFGPSDHRLSLLCGNLQIHHYIPIEEYKSEYLKEIVLATKDTIINKFSSSNNIISVSGISGGIGCTTIAMNMANILSKKLPTNNVLFIDLADTKAISNLFLGQNPLPEKTIIDLVNSDEFDLEKNLDNGLVRIRENFYAITGIQKHIDKEYIEKEVFIEKLLNYLSKASEHFNTIFIDTGVFEASSLKTTIYDISNEIELITELNLPSVSKLKTLYSLMKRAGLKEKISFILNRYDSKNSLNNADALSILNITHEDENIFRYKLSNDYNTLGRCWNECELASEVDPNSVLVKELTAILESRHILKDNDQQSEVKSFFSFFNRK